MTRLLLPYILAMSGCVSSQPTYYSHIQPIMEARCVQCHASEQIGGFSLAEYSDVQEWSGPVLSAVSNGTMPPWPAAEGPAYKNDWSLTEEQVQMISEWIDRGMPEGNPDAQRIEVTRLQQDLEQVDAVLQMNEAYQPDSAQTDDYRCFVLDWESAETEYVTGFQPRPGNPKLVHHIAAYLFRPDTLLGDSVFTQLQAWEDESPGYGYPCYGGPAGPTGNLQVPIQQLAQWVPGNSGQRLPLNSGVEVPPGSAVVLQLHYFPDASEPDATDLTSIEFTTAPKVDQIGGFAPWLDPSWPRGGMEIPAGKEGIMHIADGDPRSFFEFLNPGMDLTHGFTIHSAMLHMHELGKEGEVSIRRQTGEYEPLLTIPQWDFNWQLTYHLAEPVEFIPGDNLFLSCSFSNTGENAMDTAWGESTQEEMCVSNLFITPLP